MKAVGRRQWAGGSGQEAVGRRQRNEGSGQEAVGRRQWAVGRRQRDEGSGQEHSYASVELDEARTVSVSQNSNMPDASLKRSPNA